MLKNHPYIISTIIATVLAIVVWVFVPKEYAAVTKVSDEYKEVDLAIGLGKISAQIRDAMGGANTGMNDIEIYSKALKTEDFARAISNIVIPGEDMTYGQWVMEGRHFWQSEDTIELVGDNIEYNISTRQETLYIQFTDRDPLVASLMLDATTKHLQDIVTEARHKMADAAMHHADRIRKETLENYKKAQEEYAKYSDSHFDASLEEEIQEQKNLLSEVDNACKDYKNATEQYIRQRLLMQRAYCSFAVIKANAVPVEDTSNLWSYIWVFLTIGGTVTLTVKRIRQGNVSRSTFSDFGNFFSPWCLTVVIWIGDFFMYAIHEEIYPIHEKFISCLVIWLITFLPASLIAYWFWGDGKTTHNRINFSVPIDLHRNLFNFFLVVSALMTAFYVRAVWGIVSQFDSDNMLYNTRLLAVNNDMQLGFLNYAHGFDTALFFVAIWMFPRISKLQLTLVVVLNIAMQIAVMEKSGFLVMILGVLFVLYERRVIKVRSIAITLLLTIGLFYLFNLAKEDADSVVESTTFMEFFGMYITSPMVAFDYLHETIDAGYAANTFNSIYPYINKFGFSFQSIDRLQEFVWVPVPTNVYTIMQPFYNDFGKPGIAFFGVLYGATFGYIYRKMREGSIVCRCLYTYLVEVIIIQFYNENLMQNFITVGSATFLLFILTFNVDFNSHVSDKQIQFS